MIKKKICMLGSFGVGKTSLISQLVRSVFSEKYLSTIGVKIDRKRISIESEEVDLILWDLAGEDRFEHVQASYLSGASGFILVVDGCRRETLQVGHQILKTHQASLRDLPFVCVINKSDLKADWEITSADIADLEEQGWTVASASAKDSETVESVFKRLTTMMLNVEPSAALATIR